MPHGAPKKFTAFRLDPELLKAVQAAAEAQATSVTAAVEEGLRPWAGPHQAEGPQADPAGKASRPADRAGDRGREDQ